MAKPTLHIVYSPDKQWTWNPHTRKQQLEFKALSGKKKKEHQRTWNRVPHCCDMTKPYFRAKIAEEARSNGFEVEYWPITGRESLMAVGEAARSGKMVPGAAAFFLHAWDKPSYEKECVPAWDYYPVFNIMKDVHDMVYPHARLDQLHSEKRYASSLMPPTRFIHFVRQPNGGWQVRGKADQKVKDVVAQEMKKLHVRTNAKDLGFDDVMVKQGLSWGGFAVTRVAPGSVPDFVTQKLLPKLNEECQKLTILVQAKLDIVSELRWCMVDGKLRGNEWKSLNCPKRGQAAESAGYQNQHKAKEVVEEFVKKTLNMELPDLEKQLGEDCKKVWAEAVRDAGGEQPIYMRVDMLLDKDGRTWLNERESWGADLNGNDEFKRMDPTHKELVQRIVARMKSNLKKPRKRVQLPKTPEKKVRLSLLSTPSKSSPSKRRCVETPSPSKRRCIA